MISIPQARLSPTIAVAAVLCTISLAAMSVTVLQSRQVSRQVQNAVPPVTESPTPSPTQVPTSAPTSSKLPPQQKRQIDVQPTPKPKEPNNDDKLAEITAKIQELDARITVSQSNIDSLYKQSDKCYADLRSYKEQGIEVEQTQDCYQMYLPLMQEQQNELSRLKTERSQYEQLRMQVGS